MFEYVFCIAPYAIVCLLCCLYASCVLVASLRLLLSRPRAFSVSAEHNISDNNNEKRKKNDNDNHCRNHDYIHHDIHDHVHNTTNRNATSNSS